MITDLKVDRYYKIVIHNNCGWGEHYEKDDDWSISGIGSSIVEAIDNAFRDYYSDHHDIESLSKICALDIGNIEFEYMSGITFLGVTYYSGNLSGIDRDDFIKYGPIPSQEKLNDLVIKNKVFHHLLDIHLRYELFRIHKDKSSHFNRKETK